MPARRLTKSRFQLAMSCPAKLYYDGKPAYANRSLEDAFLNALAEGGFQVGALAPTGFDDPGPVGYGGLVTWDPDTQALETYQLPGPRFLAVTSVAAVSYTHLTLPTIYSV